MFLYARSPKASSLKAVFVFSDIRVVFRSINSLLNTVFRNFVTMFASVCEKMRV